MKSVNDVLGSVQECGGSAVLVQRHGSYMTGHVRARCPDGHVLAARNYARLEPDCMWPLAFEAIQECHAQAAMLAAAGMKVEEVIGSHQGRGPHTGQCLSEGYARATGGTWLPFRCDAAFDYPVYDYDQALAALRTVGDPMVAEWLNGKRPGLIVGETPASFERRIMSALEGLMAESGSRIVTSHFEIVTLVRALTVAGERLGSVDEGWFPVKNGGVILWRESATSQSWHAAEYGPDYTLRGVAVFTLPPAV
ncbi:MAG: hypothetical protein UY92_C0009G0047 [Candidatus Magasanikbacteria bacterium GW2011_GWA2_56_11]|uniref:Histidine phosphatase family protein n=1 Tax=Candidatus Magasanikbacteria bacterium GW2011_GWA2_56_11 TaxID=1619044 RepID=A0A0G1YFM9_9BACT|nr:MAG: hypothetical protein UY92_C0009G0047 [Candidatus Magasanikbacteria bacterium GW2011_GWA2_56_11]